MVENQKDPFNGSVEIMKKFGYTFVGVFNEGRAKARQDSAWFHICRDGSPAYSERYEYVHDFVNGFALVRRKGMLAHIKTDGRLLYPEWYEDAGNFLNGYAAVQKNGLWSHVKTDGTLAHGQWFQWALDFKICRDLEKEELLATVRKPDMGRIKGETFEIRPDGTRFHPKQAPEAQ